jgi:type IV pilus assembly protein PilB
MRLGDMLIKQGVITQKQLQQALLVQKQNGKKLGNVLLGEGFVTEREMMETLQTQLNIPYIDLMTVSIPQAVTNLVPHNMAVRHHLVPFKLEQGVLSVAMDDPLDFVAVEDVRMMTNLKIDVYLSTNQSIKSRIQTLYGNEMAEKAIKDFNRESIETEQPLAVQSEASEQDVNNAPIVRLIQGMIEQAVEEGASDIHIEPLDSDVRVRFRIDGRLVYRITIPKKAHPAVITRIKILGGMDIAERRKPQDGRIEQKIKGSQIDFRVSTLPTVFGEKAVIRILNRSTFLIPKEELGFTQESMNKFNQLLSRSHGIILITGPTGSGKTTTMYTMLNELNTIADNIITLEDPVEFMVRGLNQVQVNVRAGLTFASGLRSILRQDPDIIMIGEMRDAETVEIAIRAAITGHLVLSTLHTNDAPSTITRLIDMGIQPYLLASSLEGIISQRLMRRLCKRCSVHYQPEKDELRRFGIKPLDNIMFKKPVGCSYCSNTGYRGRIAVHEILMFDNTLRAMITEGASIDNIRTYAIRNGMRTVGVEASRLLIEGITSVEEAGRIAYAGVK